MANVNKLLNKAKTGRKDEFYTCLEDIERELWHYEKYFHNATVLCNCDDPYESNFFKYFAMNFQHLGLKKLIATCYDGSPVMGNELDFAEVKQSERHPYKVEITSVPDMNHDGAVDITDVESFLKSNQAPITELKGNGDFRSEECIELLVEADIVVTNPPFSLFREYVAQLIEYKKKFIIIGHQNAITYKEIFPLIMQNKLWLGYGFKGNVGFFQSPYDDTAVSSQHKEGLIRVSGVMWFINLDIDKRHEKMDLYKKYTSEEYPCYDNYNAINVNKTAEIPCDYDGFMGVPITFMDKYNPDQFEIIGITKTWFGGASKTYDNQIQVNKDGRKSNVSKLNDGPALKLDKAPKGKTYYIVENNPYIQTYARILIKNKYPEN